LKAIPNFINELTYQPSGQRSRCEFQNGVITNHEYDPRLRLTRILTTSKDDTLQDLNYGYDQADNLTRIMDARSLPLDDPRNQTASFLVDNCYRLIRAQGDGYGTIQYDYDRLGNMVTQTSPDIVDPDVNLGVMRSGGLGGTFDRIGRAPSDPPGPHALTEVTNGLSNRLYDYDSNGNMTLNNGDQYLFDFKDRLGKIIKGSSDILYLYDWTNRRVIKRVDGVQTTYISSLSEVRDGSMLNYVFASGTRVAQVRGPIPPPPSVVQRLPLSRGWNLISFQVEPGSSDPGILLSDLDGAYIAVYGYDGAGFLEFKPAGGGNTLTELRPNRGYWILMAEPAEWLLEGALAEGTGAPAISSMELVGLVGLTVTSSADFTAKQSGTRAVYAYRGDELGWRSYHADSPDFLNTLHSVAPGLGYWIMSAGPANSTAALAPPGASLFYHPDHLGSTDIRTGALGALAGETLYYPFGSRRHGTDADSSLTSSAYGFGGKQHDAESGLQYFEARFLAGELGRFLSTDALYAADPAAALSTPQRLHPYSYVHNNPLVFVDPSGLQDAPVYSPGYDAPEYHESFGDSVKLLAATAIGTVVDFFGGANTANAPESSTAPTQDSQTTNEVALRVAINVSFTRVVGKIVNGIVNIERTAATPFIQSAAPNAPPEWVPVEIGKPIPGLKAPPITNPKLAAALKAYTASTPAQQLANQGQGLLAQHMTFGAQRPANTLLSMAQSGQRARIGQLHLYFAGQHQQAMQAAAQQGANKPMLDSLKNLADMTLPLSGQ